MKIRVSRTHIEDGRENASSVCGCPIWIAISEAMGLDELPKRKNPLEIPRFRMASLGKVRFKLPSAAVRFQDDLAAGKKVKPFAFDLEMAN